MDEEPVPLPQAMAMSVKDWLSIWPFSSSMKCKYPQVPSELDPPTGMTYGLRPASRSLPSLIRRSSSLPMLVYSSFVTCSICAPTSLSTNRFPVRPGSESTAARLLRSMRKQSRPKYLDATAVARQWFDWIPPIVMTLSHPFALASARRNSSFLTLLPLSCIPLRSSRFTKTWTSSGMRGSFHSWIGVGKCPSLTLSLGTGCSMPAHSGGAYGLSMSNMPADPCAWHRRAAVPFRAPSDTAAGRFPRASKRCGRGTRCRAIGCSRTGLGWTAW